MKTYRDRVSDNTERILDKFLVDTEFIDELYNEIENKVNDIIDDIESEYDVKNALNKLKELSKDLY